MDVVKRIGFDKSKVNDHWHGKSTAFLRFTFYWIHSPLHPRNIEPVASATKPVQGIRGYPRIMVIATLAAWLELHLGVGDPGPVSFIF